MERRTTAFVAAAPGGRFGAARVGHVTGARGRRGGVLPATRRCRAVVTASAVTQVDHDGLEAALKNDSTTPLLVDFYAPWCGPCQFLLPVLDELATRYEGRLRILKVDTESEPELASALAIRGLPTLCFVRDGALKYRMEGALAADELASIIDQILLDAPATEA